MPVYMLVDNGSKKTEATLRLRELATLLSERSGKKVHAVSLQHADAIPADALGGQPASTFKKFLQEQLQAGESDFRVLPLFFGKSRALTSFIPQQVEALQEDFNDFSVSVADVLYPLPAGDDRLAEILLDHIEQARDGFDDKARVVLVDHGSPVPKITEVRKQVAATMNCRLSNDEAVAEAVMERREGSEYDFNGELLEDWLRQQAELGVHAVIVAMMFFLPGRHAGNCGDVESICNNVVKDYPQLQYRITPLIGEHPLLIEMLLDKIGSE